MNAKEHIGYKSTLDQVWCRQATVHNLKQGSFCVCWRYVAHWLGAYTKWSRPNKCQHRSMSPYDLSRQQYLDLGVIFPICISLLLSTTQLYALGIIELSYSIYIINRTFYCVWLTIIYCFWITKRDNNRVLFESCFTCFLLLSVLTFSSKTTKGLLLSDPCFHIELFSFLGRKTGKTRYSSELFL